MRDLFLAIFGFLGAAYGRLGSTPGGGDPGVPPAEEDLPHFTIMFR